MLWVESELFENQDIKLDFTRWKNCTFKNCNIIIKHGEYDLVNCGFDSCKLMLEGNAISILKVCKLFFPQIPLIDGSEKR